MNGTSTRWFAAATTADQMWFGVFRIANLASKFLAEKQLHGDARRQA